MNKKNKDVKKKNMFFSNLLTIQMEKCIVKVLAKRHNTHGCASFIS